MGPALCVGALSTFVLASAPADAGRQALPIVGFYNVSTMVGSPTTGFRYAVRPRIGRFLYDSATGRFAPDGVAVTPEEVPWLGRAGTIKSPSAVVHDGSIYLYFTTYDGKEFSGVGLAITDARGRHARIVGRRPVLLKEPGMGFYGTEFPRVIYDSADPNPRSRWKMWMVADPAIGYATSADGITWSYHGTCDLPSARFNRGLRIVGAVVRRGGWYDMFTQEMNKQGRWVGDAVRSRRPMGPYVRLDPAGAPVLRPLRGDSTIARLAAGSRIAVVEHRTGTFAVGEPVYLIDDRGAQLNRVAAVTARTIELRDPAERDFSGGTIRTWAWDVYFTYVWRTSQGRWLGLGTGFHSGYTHENTILVESDDPSTPASRWRVVPTTMPVWPGPYTSAENPVLAK